MEELLRRRVVGQDHTLAAVSRVLRASELNLTLNPKRPKGVFLFVGPTGVGKTELARALAEFLFGDEEKMIRIDMSEYMEKISSSRLIGTAPGYVGYNDQNQLTDEVRKNPYSLVLLDEIEKADSQMTNLFLQVFDAGRLTDGKGRTVHFDNTTIIMTSNLGTHLFSKPTVGYGGSGGSKRPAVSRSELMTEIKRHFTPEFLNRLDEIVFFDPLEPEAVAAISRMQFRQFEEQLQREGKGLVITDAAVEVLVEQGFSFEHGARNLSRVIRREVLEPMGVEALGPAWEEAVRVVVDAEDGRIVLSLVREDGVSDTDRPVPLEDEAPATLETEEDLD
jgi:ATP-dependent Clp protease ATP-binding subunit ClpC